MAIPTITPASPISTITTNPSRPSLPSNFSSSPPPTLITQGAEALLYRTTYLLPSLPCALKYRPSKPYRHPILDLRLTKHRILSEARVLVKCRKEGVCVPAVYAVDEVKGWIMMEWVVGEVVRIRLNEWLARRKEAREAEGEGEEEASSLMMRIGEAVGRLHDIGVIHGDLTTSNLMLRSLTSSAVHDSGEGEGEGEGVSHAALDGEVVIIDFGLASQSTQDEDRAVDLYVLERAFGSTHPRAEGLFKQVLRAYGDSYKGGKVVLRKLEDVRMRGRKKSMLG
ncbi:serine/threonine-protein kinase bud32 [Diplocarpon rosae]|nr:serine/threonine-protein kinase bud32 [Diplocarpon rosae]